MLGISCNGCRAWISTESKENSIACPQCGVNIQLKKKAVPVAPRPDLTWTKTDEQVKEDWRKMCAQDTTTERKNWTKKVE